MRGLKRYIFLLIFLVFSVSLLANLGRQFVLHYRISQKIAQKEEELELLKKRNQALKENLKLFESNGLSNSVPPVGGTTAGKQGIEQNYQKWLRLFTNQE